MAAWDVRIAIELASEVGVEVADSLDQRLPGTHALITIDATARRLRILRMITSDQSAVEVADTMTHRIKAVLARSGIEISRWDAIEVNPRPETTPQTAPSNTDPGITPASRFPCG